jgi:hypothetical protein
MGQVNDPHFGRRFGERVKQHHLVARDGEIDHACFAWK